ncbi:MAG: hypothetical protein B7X42_00460 [Thiomonas sp. 14-66-4]|nr:MAG: hypothetical protein B7X42_00460 [Thiomonas sp. 14-66-4]
MKSLRARLAGVVRWILHVWHEQGPQVLAALLAVACGVLQIRPQLGSLRLGFQAVVQHGTGAMTHLADLAAVPRGIIGAGLLLMAIGLVLRARVAWVISLLLAVLSAGLALGFAHRPDAVFAVAAALVVAYFYGGWAALGLTVILGIMEVTLSFDNAVVNARVLERMSPFWQKLFLTVGLLIAVVGMRLVLPVVLVVATTGLNAADVIRLALERGDPAQAGTFGFFLSEAHPQIAAFGGMFLLMLFLDFIFEDRDITWLSWLEKPLARIGKLDSLSFVVALGALLGASALSTKPAVVLTSGIVGIVVYVLVNGLGALFENAEEGKSAVHLVGKAAFFSFLYLEVLDASFSFDGVIGAFAITADPLIIALGLSCAAITLPGLASAQTPSAQTSKMTQCNADAKTKALNGEARKKFMKECLSAKKK